MYVTSIAMDFSFYFLHVLLIKFGSKQSKKGVASLRDSHAHVLAISKICPYEYKQGLFCAIAGAVLCILIVLSNGCSCIRCQLFMRRCFHFGTVG